MRLLVFVTATLMASMLSAQTPLLHKWQMQRRRAAMLRM